MKNPRTVVVVLVAIALLALTGCATEWKSRTVGQHDPSVEIAKENAATLRAMAEAMKAQAEAIARASASPSPSPTPISDLSVSNSFVYGIEPCELRACDFLSDGCPLPPTGPCLDGKPLTVPDTDIQEAMRRAQARKERDK